MTKPVALITGASRGLGAELSKIFSLTHHIIAVARIIGALEALDDEIKSKGGSCTLAPIDLTDEKATAQLCRSIFDRWGTLKIWAHTAIHAAPLGPVMTIDSSDWNKSVKNNVTALAHFIPMVTPLLGDDSEVIFEILGQLVNDKDFENIKNTFHKEKTSSILKDNTIEAFKKNIFGVPSFIFNNQIFWGQDRIFFLEKEISRIYA